MVSWDVVLDGLRVFLQWRGVVLGAVFGRL